MFLEGNDVHAGERRGEQTTDEECEHLAGISTFDLGSVPTDPVRWLQQLIEDERIDVVYSLLNAWDGSNQATAALLRRGCPVPVVRHYKEHLLDPDADKQVCVE